MSQEEVGPLYVCARCIRIELKEGHCPTCGRELIECRPGAPDDPARRPLLDSRGSVRTRAPLWWLRHTVGRLVGFLGKD